MIREIEQLVMDGYTVKIARDGDSFSVAVYDQDEDVVAEAFDSSLAEAIAEAHRFTPECGQ